MSAYRLVTVSNLTAYSMSYFNPACYGANVTNSIVMSGVSSLNPTNPFFATTNLYIDGIGFFDASGAVASVRVVAADI